ncbi:MAG: hypothetical protein H6988_12535 [Pseudomonadales bacterium]|nr:hypothetical protein [Pseudomonadales bacterium]
MATKRGIQHQRAERMAQVMQHRKAGLPYSRIGTLLGISKAEAHRLGQAALEDFRHRTAQDTDEAVALAIARLDGAIEAINESVATGNLPAIETMVRIEARRARLLGLDRPAKVAPTSPDGTQPYEGGGLAEMLAEARQLRKD